MLNMKFLELLKKTLNSKQIIQLFNFKFTEAKFLHNSFRHNLIAYMVTIEKLLILHIVAFMPLEIAK